jgi:hypothetical protein
MAQFVPGEWDTWYIVSRGHFLPKSEMGGLERSVGANVRREWWDHSQSIATVHQGRPLGSRDEHVVRSAIKAVECHQSCGVPSKLWSAIKAVECHQSCGVPSKLRSAIKAAEYEEVHRHIHILPSSASLRSRLQVGNEK